MPHCETDRPRNIVCTMMTLAEYEERRKLPHADPTLLVNYSSQTGQRYDEEAIPRILADIGEFTGIAPENTEPWVNEYDCSQWPARLKADIMDAVQKHWLPDGSFNDSNWTGNQKQAAAFYARFPELTDVFAQSPRTIALRWQERTGNR